MSPSEPGRKMVRSVFTSFSLQSLMFLWCVSCALVDRNLAAGVSPYLVYTSGAVIYRVNVDGSGGATVLDSTSQEKPNKLGIDFDYNRGRLYWVDSTQLKIMSSTMNGTDVRTVVSTGFSTLERLAYDWISDKIYWSDYGAAEIGIVDFQTDIRMVLIQTGQPQLSRPRALALDPTTRNMYWADWLEESQTAVIERASMDGQDRVAIVSTSLSRPYDLALDIDRQKLYFMDGYLDHLESVDIDGSNRQILLSFRQNVVPYSLVFHDGSLYWTERIDRLISRFTLNGSVQTNVTSMDVRPAGLAMISSDGQPLVNNPCSSSRCSHVCLLSSSHPREYTCACSEGIKLAEDNFTCRVLKPTTTTPAPSTPAPSTPALLPSPSTSPRVCPCKNGGVCRPKSSGQGLECYCPKNFTGDLCQHLIEDAGVCEIAMPCKNRATCIDTGVYEYKCLCAEGYEGRYCQDRVNYGVCNTTKPCFHDGVCTNLKDEEPAYTCACKEGFSGDNCTQVVWKGISHRGISPTILAGVVALFTIVTCTLIIIIICILMLYRRPKEKPNVHVIDEATCTSRSESPMNSRSDSPMFGKSDHKPSELTPPSMDHDYWSIRTSLNKLPTPPVPHGQPNVYSQAPQRAPRRPSARPPNLKKYARATDNRSRESKVLTV